MVLVPDQEAINGGSERACDEDDGELSLLCQRD